MRRQVQRALRVMENEWWQSYPDEMQCYFNRCDTHNFCNSLKLAFGPTEKSLAPVRTTNGDLIKNKSGILSRWAEHLSDLLNCVHPTDLSFIEAVPKLNVIHELDMRPTLEEIRKAIAFLKCHKAAVVQQLSHKIRSNCAFFDISMKPIP